MLSENVRRKIALNANLNAEDIITGVDVNDVYKIPLVFEEQGMSQLLARKLDLVIRPKLDEWKRLVMTRESAGNGVTIAIAGKYTNLEDSYASIIEALNHCSSHFGIKIKIKWINTRDENNLSLDGIDGVIVPGGFGSEGTEGKIKVVRECREKKIPFLGICYGLQMAVIEFARNVCGEACANTTEVDVSCAYPVVDILASQKDVTNKGGTMRLGAYPAVIKEGSLVHELYGIREVSERHRHRFEVNPDCHKILEENGLILSGLSPDGTLVEFIELSRGEHPYFVATQAHPELKSSLIKPAPLFKGLIDAVLKRKGIR